MVYRTWYFFTCCCQLTLWGPTVGGLGMVVGSCRAACCVIAVRTRDGSLHNGQAARVVSIGRCCNRHFFGLPVLKRLSSHYTHIGARYHHSARTLPQKGTRRIHVIESKRAYPKRHDAMVPDSKSAQAWRNLE